jgi:UDP-N-acetylmuramoyl-tripeptide--D-alanyl-D-alanine ligase
MKLTPNDIRKLKPVEIRNAEMLERKPMTGVSTDSRTVLQGDLFVALRGPNFDGHRFIAEAVARGARAVMVDGTVRRGLWPRVPEIVVDDTMLALGNLARLYRRKFNIPVVAIGGSSGKTTTKEMAAAVLGARYRVLCTEKNFNNQVGVPKTLFRLDETQEIAVVEIGTNHPGELRVLCEILEPTHGLLTNIGREHLEFFQSIDGVEEEEGVLFDHLAQRSGTQAFVNADDPRVVARARWCRKKLAYGFGSRVSGIRGRKLRLGDTACARFEFTGGRTKKPVPVQLGIPGRHNAANALAAAAVGLAFRVPPGSIAGALKAFRASDKRMEVLDMAGVTVLNDTYNANPDSTIAALETLAAMRVPGKRIAVLGDMLELGSREKEEHRRVGEAASQFGIEYLLTFGPRARQIHEAAATAFAVHYEQKNVLAEYLAELVAPGDAVLLKGSRGTAMEDLVTFLGERLRGTAQRQSVLS